MDTDILKIDLDCKFKWQAINLLGERLGYMNDLNFFHFHNINTVTLIKKSTYGAKIKLKKKLTPEQIVIFQLILGSDYRKEVNTLLNHHKFGMEYSNRLFTCKRYKGNKIKVAKIIDITTILENKVYAENRKHNSS